MCSIVNMAGLIDFKRVDKQAPRSSKHVMIQHAPNMLIKLAECPTNCSRQEANLDWK